MEKQIIKLFNVMYRGRCLYCKNKTDDIMKTIPEGFLMCGTCRALSREYHNVQFMVLQEPFVTPLGKVLEPKEEFIPLDESKFKKMSVKERDLIESKEEGEIDIGEELDEDETI